MTLNPASCVSEIQLQRFEHFSPEDMEGVVDTAKLSHIQIGKGRFNGSALRVLSDGKVFDTGIYDQSILAQGEMPPGHMCIGFILPAQTGGLIQGRPLNGPTPVLYSEGAELYARFEPGTRWVGFQVARQEIETCGVELREQYSGSVTFVPESCERLIKEIGSALRDFERSAKAGFGPKSMCFVEERFERLLIAFTCAQSRETSESYCQSIQRHRLLVHNAVEYMNTHMADSVRIRDLCVILSVSYTTLERAFVSVLGVTPHRYLSLARLSRARRLLLNANRQSTRVSDIAVDCGCVELGRFSRDYRQWFGETPSQTLS